MFATIHRYRRWPDEESEAWGRDALGTLLAGARPAGACVLGRLDGRDGAVVALWEEKGQAAASATRTVEGALSLDASVYAVVQIDPGAARAETPHFAQLVWLNGTGDAGRADAAIRAGRERIAPATRDVDGVVGTWVLRADDHRIAVLTLVTGVDTPETMRRAILGTELLPWEERAQLIDPDRIDIDRVLVAQLPVEVRS